MTNPFLQRCEFVTGAADEKGLPEEKLPEIAFAGRSNVGKSSLINALTGRKALARTSNTPGRTRQLNFFNIGNKIMLVDLPGYGYARVSKKEVAAWNRLMRNYLSGRANLRRVMLLVDSRHGIKESDGEIMAMLDEAAVSFQLVLTKTDKPKRTELAQMKEKLHDALRNHPAAYPEILFTSATKKYGIEELRNNIAQFA